MSEIEAVVTDMDDTLSDSFGIRARCVQEVARRCYGRIVTLEEVRALWGLPFPEYISRIYATDAPYAEVAARHFEIAAEYPLRLFEGVRQALDLLLARLPVGILTASNRDIVNMDFPDLGLRQEEFFTVQTSDDTPFHKPDPRVFDPVLAKLQHMGIKPSNVVYVGDGLKDLSAARGAGLQFIGVTTGFATAEEFRAQGAISFSSFSEIPGQVFTT